MSEELSFRRRLALGLASHASRILPAARAPWAEAMCNETLLIEDDGAALSWAVGTVLTAYLEFGSATSATLWMRSLFAFLALSRAMAALFAPAMVLAYRVQDLKLEAILGAQTPGDDYRRFITLMNATPGLLLALWALSGLFYLATAWQVMQKRRGALVYFCIAVALQLAGSAWPLLSPDYARISHATFTFASANFRRDYLIPAGQIVIVLFLGLGIRLKDRGSTRDAQ